MKELTRIPFHDTAIYTTADGAHVALRPVCEALDLDYASQFKRVQNQPWATVVIMTTVAADSKMREKGATADEVTRFASAFGRYVKEAYKTERGAEPGKRFDETPSGQVRETYAYTEADRPIFDRAWGKSYAGGFPARKTKKEKK